MTIHLKVTDHEALMIAAALQAVSPSGGGSDPFMLFLKVQGAIPAPFPLEELSNLTQVFCNTVLNEAIEHNVVTRNPPTR